MSGRYGSCLFGRRPVANTNANGERQTPSRPVAGYINSPAVERKDLGVSLKEDEYGHKR